MKISHFHSDVNMILLKQLAMLYYDIITISKGGFNMATNKIPTMLRLPAELHKKIKKLSDIECRSMNAEIEFAISKYISEYESKNGPIPVNSDDLYQ